MIDRIPVVRRLPLLEQTRPQILLATLILMGVLLGTAHATEPYLPGKLWLVTFVSVTLIARFVLI